MKIKQKINLPDDVRLKGRTILTETLGILFTKNELDELEHSIANATIKLSEKEDKRVARSYDQILRRTCIHLDPNSPIKNTYLLNRVQNGIIKLSDIPNMSSLKLDPHAWSKQITIQKVEAMQVATGVQKAKSSLIKCRNCGSAVNYEEKQMRSADEAADINVECPKCGKTWRQ